MGSIDRRTLLPCSILAGNMPGSSGMGSGSLPRVKHYGSLMPGASPLINSCARKWILVLCPKEDRASAHRSPQSSQRKGVKIEDNQRP
jgi:hypothetical protein